MPRCSSVVRQRYRRTLLCCTIAARRDKWSCALGRYFFQTIILTISTDETIWDNGIAGHKDYSVQVEDVSDDQRCFVTPLQSLVLFEKCWLFFFECRAGMPITFWEKKKRDQKRDHSTTYDMSLLYLKRHPTYCFYCFLGTIYVTKNAKKRRVRNTPTTQYSLLVTTIKMVK